MRWLSDHWVLFGRIVKKGFFCTGRWDQLFPKYLKLLTALHALLLNEIIGEIIRVHPANEYLCV